ncbi:hypothetical protein TSH7_20275 [Azospirillum sp. TSH7]|uniref:tetratricopeptide repeat protein n=1 Tax=unclassified Azospirillum TaxID=2630922 RepID=UPI000D6228EB|nr:MULTISPECIES: tetratricopeptide repeat protein [unclassified Azospirillum]PWC59588.1 hypothetical protein TSH7_20275 [Azospirillum sp. TSH7]PWC63149.1 hypothetical protein TSH20_20535 [Azospirillum sp. TSH20]
MPTLEEAFRIAIDHHHAGRLAEAEAVYESILAAIPDQPEAMSNLGYAQQMQGKLAAAAATYRKVLAKWPDRPQPHARLGELMQWTGRWGSAVDCYETAVSLAPKDEGLAAQLDRAVSLASRHQALREPLRRGERLDLRDVTFLVPCRIESPDRRRNLRILVTYLRRHLDTNILICEDNPERQDVPGIMAELGLSSADYGYIHLTSNDSPYTHRGKQLNIMAAAATTPIVVGQDTDVLVEPTQYVLARQAVHDGVALACPFNGLFFDVGPDFVPGVERTLSVNQIDLFDPRNEMLYKNSYSGSVFFGRWVFDRLGGFNEKFVSWGWEDFELYRRLELLGERVERTLGPLLHLSHARSTNSVTENPWYAHNTAEYERVVSMTPDQIRAEIAAGSFHRPLVSAGTVPGWVEPPTS